MKYEYVIILHSRNVPGLTTSLLASEQQWSEYATGLSEILYSSSTLNASVECCAIIVQHRSADISALSRRG